MMASVEIDTQPLRRPLPPKRQGAAIFPRTVKRGLEFDRGQSIVAVRKFQPEGSMASSELNRLGACLRSGRAMTGIGPNALAPHVRDSLPSPPA